MGHGLTWCPVVIIASGAVLDHKVALTLGDIQVEGICMASPPPMCSHNGPPTPTPQQGLTPGWVQTNPCPRLACNAEPRSLRPALAVGVF